MTEKTLAQYGEELKNIVADILQQAKEQPGVTQAAVSAGIDAGLSVNVRMGEVETIEFHHEKSVGIAVYKGQRKGATSITDISPSAIKDAIQAACRIADFTQEDQYAGLPDKDKLATAIPELQLHHLTPVSADQAQEWALESEKNALSYDSKIANSLGAGFGSNEKYYVYGNTFDFLESYQSTRYSGNCCVIGKEGDTMQRDYDFTIARDYNDLESAKKVGVQAAEKTLARLGARKIPTCKAPVILVPETAASLWSALVSAISGSNLYRKATFLLDHLDKKIFPDFVEVTEQPHLHKYLGSSPFDNEGVATNSKHIVKDGILNSYLLNSYTARRLGMQTTGNAGGVHNMLIKTSDKDFPELLQAMGTGLVVTSTMGRGTNIVTGDFSVGANGFWVENGQVVYPVEEVTIAGNLKDMFTNIQAIGNDIDKRSNIITGSVWLAEMTIAGS